MKNDHLVRLIQCCEESIETSRVYLKNIDTVPDSDDYKDVEKDMQLVRDIKMELVKEQVTAQVTRSIETYFKEATDVEDWPTDPDAAERTEDFYLYMSHVMDKE